ncbi:MAG: response regulator transcription factor [Bacteroidales bacterium]|nr:response regulator transcription factor [Bacteroidales bacterium]
MEKVKVLLVEDDLNLGFLLLEFLESNNFDVKLYKDGESGLNAYKTGSFDFCILDIMLPKLDGFSLAKKIKAENNDIPIIFLTAKSLKEDKIKGFKIGIDDYITKPFEEEELLYRINAILKRVGFKNDSIREEIINIGTFSFDVQNQNLICKDIERRLTVKESEILRLLCLSKNKIVKRDDIMISVWGDNDYFIGRSLDVFVSKLRKYLESDPGVKIESIPRAGLILSEKLSG